MKHTLATQLMSDAGIPTGLELLPIAIKKHHSLEFTVHTASRHSSKREKERE